MPIVTIKNVGGVGYIADQPPHELDPAAWSNIQNIRFLEGAAWRALGDTQVFTTPSVTPYYIASYNTSLSRFIVHAGNTAVYVDDGSTRTDITGTAPTGTEANRWTGGTLNGVLVMNNGVDVPTYWGGDVATNLASLTGWNANWRAASLRPFKNYLVALDVTKSGARYPHMVKWSHTADPGTIPSSWDETDPAVDAGEVDLAETSDFVIDCLPLGGTNIIYKEHSMYAMTYIGGQFIWQFQRLPGSYGALAPGCVVDTPVGHVVLTPGDVVLHKGGAPESIISGRLKRWLFATINPSYYTRSFLTVNPTKNEVWVCFPADNSTTCTKAAVWNWREDIWSTRDLQSVTYGAVAQAATTSGDAWSSDSDSWASDASAWGTTALQPSEKQLFLCTAAPKILTADTATTFAGTSFTATLERTGLAFGDASVVKTVRSIYPRVEGVSGQTLYVQVGAAMDVEAGYTWSAAVPYTIGTSYKADTFASGRFIAVRFYSTADASWKVRSYDVDFVTQGKY